MNDEWPLPPGIVQLIADLWGGTNLQLLSSEKNLVVSFESTEPGVLRIHTQNERDEKLVLAELDWVRFLYERGVRVAPPLPTLDGRWTVRFPLNEERAVYAAAFLKIPGVRPVITTKNGWNVKLVEQMGEILGKIHSLNSQYQPPSKTRRFDWTKQDVKRFAAAVIPESEKKVWETFRRHWRRGKSLPRTHETFGLTHGDYHPGNLLIDSGVVTVIDFDNCCYDWYAADVAHFLAMSLLPLSQATREVREQAAAELFDSFMQGYLRQRVPPEDLIAALPHFLMKFDLIFYLNLRARALNLSPENPFSPYFNYVRANIEAGHPGLRIDFLGRYRALRGEPARPSRAEPPGLVETLIQIPLRLLRLLGRVGKGNSN